ncbi:nitroreductase/quinone reductase family protein [Demequina salsinemoris]|uniref:nitroreductase/quinone reductase family protein n=1 Tax=Demequina salsinemoris TaxID=577470 RepID=UPI000785A7FE|nr:nitroreductase/quinone reductase family protein [Demequina salsinemoris]
MDPQSYSARTRYRRPAAWYLRLNWLGVALTSVGLAPRGAVTIAIRGRKSGRIRKLPILAIPVEGHRYLVALAGEAQWVRNVRAAGGRVTMRRGRRREVTLVELPVDQRAPVLKAYIGFGETLGGAKTASQQAEFYFGVDRDASLEELATIAEHYPVFRIDPA